MRLQGDELHHSGYLFTNAQPVVSYENLSYYVEGYINPQCFTLLTLAISLAEVNLYHICTMYSLLH